MYQQQRHSIIEVDDETSTDRTLRRCYIKIASAIVIAIILSFVYLIKIFEVKLNPPVITKHPSIDSKVPIYL